MSDKRETRTYGEPMPLHSQRATYDGHRSVRLLNDNIGLATTTYSYKLGYDEVQEAAERIALMWNLHLGESVEELRHRYLDTPAPQTHPHLAELDEATKQKLREALRFSASRSVMSAEDERRILSALEEPAPSQHVAGPEAAIRKAGQVVIDDLIDRGGWCIASNDDLADFMTRIVDACVRAALSPKEETR